MLKKGLFIGGLLLICLLPSVTQARKVVELSSDAIGITEADYKELKNAECVVVVGNSDTPLDCGAVVKELMQDKVFYTGEQVIFRAEHYGEMYRIDNSTVGPLKIKRYLPNGFYSVTNKKGLRYYWVADGKKQIMSAGTAYSKTMQSAQTNDGRIIPISEYDYQTLQWGCDFCDGYPRIIEQKELLKKLDGSIIMRVEAEGQLYYIEDENLHDYTPSISANIKDLAHLHNTVELFVFMKQHSAPVVPGVLKNLPTI